jgi:ATP-dependent Clp protease protease subunit
MQIIKPDVATICLGQAASMGAVLLCGGAKGKRYCLQNARVMIHQGSAGAQGTITDMNVALAEFNRYNEIIFDTIAHHTGQDAKKVREDCDRDYFMSADQAREYGLIDKVLKPGER